MARAEGNNAFRLAAYALSDLVDQSGEPESEVELAIGQNRDLLVLFRLCRIAAQVNNRLAGRPTGKRLTEEEWKELDHARQKQAMMAQFAQAQALAQAAHWQAAMPPMAELASPGALYPVGLGNIGKTPEFSDEVPPRPSGIGKSLTADLSELLGIGK